MIFLENETEIELNIDYKDVAEKVISTALSIEGCPFDTEVNIMLTDVEGIREINKDTRDIDAPTDVLSFPTLYYDTPSDFVIDEEDLADFVNPENGLIVFGDIVINLNRVVTQAKAYGHSILREYAFLIAHSILHLCGYDHMEPEEATVMEAKQEEILTTLNITRD